MHDTSNYIATIEGKESPQLFFLEYVNMKYTLF